ncbi:neuronal PAS domain-containing protein 4-like [Electrophorus electricus]|uniref:neuronal PAS domain-containing protein 4-like n=1 Tax=Electrophorus electricus TaxID=8005 RepID=UPI0015D00A77|nr:neuronal PAS domain-containing protein 4-like [Electrophorus electricus]
MTVGCSSCKNPASARSSSSSCTPLTNENISPRICKRFRSTKGASKARRDHINGEIRNMRALLPISAEEQERLSYLHSMSVICTFIRKSVLLPRHKGSSEEGFMHPYEDLLHALPGFIVAMTKEGKLIYLSENVSQYLGFSMVDVLQGDTFYDMVDNCDVDTVKFNLEVDDVATEKSFVCRMHTSKAFRLQHGSCCPLLVRGRFQDGPQHRLFVALCTPIVSRQRESDSVSVHFQTLHRPDMSYRHAHDSVVFHLGYKAEEIVGRSWYSLLHPDDLSVSACGHKHLMQQSGDGQLELVLRLQAKDLAWVWLYVWAAKEAQSQEVTCTNYVISETEAIYMREKLSSNLSLSPPASQMPWGPSRSPKRQAECNAQYDRQKRKSRRLSEPTVSYCASASPSRDKGDSCTATGDHQAFFSTPPYSPASSFSSAANDDCSSDFMQEVYGHSGRLVSPSFCPQPCDQLPSHAFTLSSFSLDSHPSTQTTYSYQDCLNEGNLVPNYQTETCDDSSNCVLHPDDFSLPPLPMSGGDGAYHVSDNSGSSSPIEQLTPDPSTTADSSLHYSEREQVEISILAHQISSLASSFDIYRAKSSVPWVNHAPCWLPMAPLNPEPLLDEGVIGSILKDWTGEPAKREASCSWGQVSRAPLEDVAEVQALTLDTLVDSPPLDLHSADSSLGPCVSRHGCHEDNIELHQLSLYLHDDFQQDGFVDESMY